MQKVVDFLERYVQWLVLGIAVLYVAYTVYFYVVASPLTQTIGVGANTLNAKPGDIDTFIRDKEVVPLEADLKNPVIDAPKVTDVRNVFDAGFNMKRVEVADLTCPFDAPLQGIVNQTVDVTPTGGLVKALPTDLPPAVFVNSSTGRTVLKDGNKDISYNGVRFKIDANQVKNVLSASYKGSPVPPSAWSSLELAEVELLREQQMPNGAWSAPQVVKPLTVNVIPTFPGQNQPDAAKLTYKQWIDDHQDALMHPAFYPVAEGAPAVIQPGAPVAAAAPATPGAPPAVFAPPSPAMPQAAMVNPSGDLDIVQWDTTIKEGTRYRYSLRYKLYNPLFTKKLLAQPQVAAVLGVNGPDPVADKNPSAGVWSGELSVEPSAYVFISKINVFAGGNANYELFEWRGGQWHRLENKKGVTPGDTINGANGATRWTVVDVRKDPKPGGTSYVLLMDENGSLERHDENDQTLPDLVKLRGLAAPPPAAAAAAN